MSPELTEAVADAHEIPLNSPAYDTRGFIVTGPECIHPHDPIVWLMEEARLALADEHYARGSPDEERRALKLASGRRVFSAKEAGKQRALILGAA